MRIDAPRDVAMAEGSASEVDAQNESFKEVLVVFRDRRRPVKFQVSNDPSEEKSSLLQAVRDAFSDVFPDLATGEEAWSGSSSYFLQTDQFLCRRVVVIQA